MKSHETTYEHKRTTVEILDRQIDRQQQLQTAADRQLQTDSCRQTDRQLQTDSNSRQTAAVINYLIR